MVALLLLPHTPPRTLRPVHETRGASLHMLGEVLWHLVQLGITSSTEECDPKVLPCVTIGGDGVFVHYPTVRAVDFHRNRGSPATSNPPRAACELCTLGRTEITCPEV